MKFLLDTHMLLWASESPERLSAAAVGIMETPENELLFSSVSIWETAIKFSRRKPDFQVNPNLLRAGLHRNGWSELPMRGDHAILVAGLPPIHRDPFDRILIAQAIVEGITLLTADPKVAKYAGPIRLV